MWQKVFVILVLLTIGLRVGSQTVDGYNYSYYNFSKTDGIPEVNVFSIVQDHQGFIYAGAGAGLYVHYGHKWQHLPSPIDNEDNNIGSYLHEMVFNPSNKMIYLGSQTDVQCYDTQSGKFTRVKARKGFHDAQKYNFFYHEATEVLVPTTEGIFQINNDTLIPFKPALKWPKDVDKTCRAIESIDKERIVLFFTGQIGVYNIVKDEFELYDHPLGGTLGKGVYDKLRNKIWFQSYQKIYFFDLNTMKFGIKLGSENDFECRNIILKDNHQLWISSGTFFDLNKNKWEHIPYAEGKHGNAIVYWPRFLIDKENNLWTSSQGYNLNVLFDKNKHVRNIKFIQQGISREPISALAVKDILYVTNSDNGYIFKYDIKSLKSKFIKIADKGPIYNLRYDDLNTLFMTSTDAIYTFDMNKEINTRIDLFFDDQKKIGKLDYLISFEDKLLYGGEKGFVVRNHNLKDSTFISISDHAKGIFNSIYYEAIDQNIYLIFAKEIIIYNIRSKVISALNINKLGIKNSFQVVRSGDYLYISSLSDGFYRYDLKTKKLINFNKNNSLLESNYVSLLAKDGKNIWVGTIQGLFVYNPQYSCFTSKLDRQIGFKHDATSYGIITNDDYAIKLTYANIDIIDKKAMAITNHVPLYIYDINIENTEKLPIPICKDTTLTLSENESIIDITYGLPYFTNYNYNNFQYRILGYDTIWKATFSTTLRLPKFDVGSYTLEIRAWKSNGEQVDEIRKLTFNIQPLFYKTWWFILSVITVISYLIFAIYRLKIDKIKTELTLKNKYEKQISDLEMKALRAQMNPHFVFNSLNSIENFILKNDKVMASEYLGKFSKLIRNILDHSRTEVIPLTKEIETLKLYIDLEAIRTDNSFRVVYEIDHELLDDNINIPPMLMQPHVENAIIHGLKYLEDKTGLLKVTLKNISDDHIEYRIEDNGIGRQKSIEIKSANAFNHKSYGMDITQNRVNLHNQRYKTNITFTINDVIKDGVVGGTIVQFFIPFQ